MAPSSYQDKKSLSRFKIVEKIGVSEWPVLERFTLEDVGKELRKFSHWVCWSIGQKVFEFLLDFKVDGKKNLKNFSGPLIVAFNHSSWLDAFFIMAAIPPNSQIAPVRFAVWKGHYKKLWLRPFLALEGSFPISKGIGLKKSLQTALEILKKGGAVGIAPEEKRRHLGRPRKPRRGVAFLALATGSPILPIFIEGAIGLKISDIARRKRKIKIKIGKMFHLAQNSPHPDLTNLANLVIQRTYQMKGGKQ